MVPLQPEMSASPPHGHTIYILFQRIPSNSHHLLLPYIRPLEALGVLMRKTQAPPSYLRMKPPLMAICSRSSTTRAGWLATTPSWLFPQALLAPLFILAAGRDGEDEEGQLLNSLTERFIIYLNQAGSPLVKIYNESLGFEVLQQHIQYMFIYQYVAWSADTKVLFGFMHPAHKYMSNSGD